MFSSMQLQMDHTAKEKLVTTLTMADESEIERSTKVDGVRRSSRNRNVELKLSKIATIHLRRFHQLFWQESPFLLTHSSLKRRKLNDCHSRSLKFRKIPLDQVYTSPNIYTIDGFLSETELLYLERVSEQFPFQQSFVDTPDQKSIRDVEQRTSTFLSLTKLGNATVASIERKAADLLGVSLPSIEPLQLVRYQKGQFFGIHHDLGSLFVDGSVELPPRQPWARRRLATLFCYLNDIKSDADGDTGGGGGGCTFFPACGDLRIRPKRGMAVLFCNILETGMPDPKTIHAGEPVTGDTVKLGLNIWCCE